MKALNALILSTLFTQAGFADFDTQKASEAAGKAKSIIIPGDDSADWVFSYKVMLGDGSTIYEWVPTGETVDDWTKLIQVQFIPLEGQKIDAKDFGDAFVKSLKEMVPEANASMTSTSKDRVFVEWIVPKDTKDQQAQDELAQFISTPDGIYRVAYTEKVPAIDPQVKQKWTERLSNVKVQ